MPPARTLELLALDKTSARLPAPFSSRVRPTLLSDPLLVSFNPDAAALGALLATRQAFDSRTVGFRFRLQAEGCAEAERAANARGGKGSRQGRPH